MCRVAELRGARAPCPDLLEKNFSPKPLFVGYHCAVHERHVQICWKKNFSPKPLFVGFMAISVSGYYGDFISVGTGGY